MTRDLASYRYRLAQIVTDLGVFAAAFVLAYLVRFDWEPSLAAIKRLLFQLPYVVVFETLVLYIAGAHRLIWRFVSLRDTVRLGWAVVASTAVLLVLRIWAPELEWGYHIYAMVPVGIIATNFVLALVGVVGVRALRRLAHERRERLERGSSGGQRRVLVVGAGRSGQGAVKEMLSRPDLGLVPVGFLDDDPNKVGSVIQAVRVLATSERLPELAKAHDVDEVIIAMSQAPGEVVRRVVALARQAEVPAKILPGLYELIGGVAGVSRLRDVQIEDLLGRPSVELDSGGMQAFMRGKVALVTGAGGSIGSELCRQIAAFAPRRLVLVERAENALFEIHNELVRRFPALDVAPCIADVTDERRLSQVLERLGCDVIFHAAAHKHVPMMEWNPGEAIKNNILGTKTVADLAQKHGVGHFVLISTDKAINPTSIMGASKRVAELYVQGLAQKATQTVYVAVRFGNVLGSAGSVIPIFKKQIAAGGPVTVTHPDMKRYFMTIPEAAQLVLQAGTLGQGGEVFILDMGEPVRIVDLARDLISLSGLKPDVDIRIEFTGVRPGEKLFEVLSTEAERAAKTRHPKIFVGRIPPPDEARVGAQIQELLSLADKHDEAKLRQALAALVPEYQGAPEREGQAQGATAEARQPVSVR